MEIAARMRMRLLRIDMVFFLIWAVSTGTDVEAYDRVISLAPAITEIIYALEANEKLIAVTDYCDFPADAKGKETVGGFINPSVEKIIALKPDLVILSPNGGTRAIEHRLAAEGVKTMVVDFNGLRQLKETYRTLCETFGTEGKARELRDTLDQTIRMIQEHVQGQIKPRVVFVRSHDPLVVAAGATFEDDLIRSAGGINGVRNTSVRYPRYSLEQIIAINPDVIIDATFYETPTHAQERALCRFWMSFDMIEAIKRDRLYVIETDIHSVPGPRTPECITIVATILFPHLFTEKQPLIRHIIRAEEP